MIPLLIPYRFSGPVAGPSSGISLAIAAHDFGDGSSQLAASDVPFPPGAIRIMEEGWKEYLPLTLILTEYSRGMQFAPRRSEATQLRNGVLVNRDLATLENSEHWMVMTDFLDAADRMPRLIRMHYSPRGGREVLASAWAAHYHNVVHHPDFRTFPGLLIQYDMDIRRRAVARQRFNPGTWQSSIYDAVKSDYLLYRQDRFDLQGYVWRTSGPANAPTAPPMVSRSTAPVVPPAAFQDNRTTSKDRPALEAPASRCFLCGGRFHVSTQCSTSPLPYLRSEGSLKLTPQGISICYSHNTRGCRSQACNFAHLCSLCGSKDHAAQRCRAV